MHKSKLIRHLRHFSPKEMVQLGYYLNSPFFFRGKTDVKLVALFHLLHGYHPSFDHKKMAKETVFKALFPKKTYNEQALQQLMTRFNKAMKGYIMQAFQLQTFGFPPPEMGMAHFYQQKKMHPHFEHLHEEMTKDWSKELPKRPAHFWYEFLLAKQLSDHQSHFNIRHTDLNLPKTLTHLDDFYIAMKLEFACGFLSQKKHHFPIQENGELATIKALLPLLRDGQFRDNPLVDLLYHTYLLLQENASEADYQRLKVLYDAVAMQVGLIQRQIVHGALRNYCSSQINAGRKEYQEEILMLYQNGLPQEVLYTNGGLVASTFQNMITMGLRLERYEWVEQFLEEHRHRIISLEPESIYSLYKANLLFAQQEFEEALEHLTYNFADIYFKLVARRLEIQIYYELQSTILDAKIQAFKVFVFRTSKSLLTQVQQEGYSNFIDLLKQILHPSTKYNPKRIANLIKKLNDKKTVAEKSWLMQKLLELE